MAGELGFIGLGAMGEGMSSNLTRKSDRIVHVYDLSPDPVARLTALGAVAASSVVEVAARADVVFLSLPSIAEVEQVCEEIAASEHHPATIVDMSTSDVRRTRALSEQMAGAGIDFVDAPVARMRQAAKDGTLLILVGATEQQFDDLKPLLDTMGTDVIRCGPVGNGQVIKILNNMVVAANVRALAEAIAIGRTAGVDGQAVRDLLALGSADSFMLHSPATTALVSDEFPFHAFPTTYMIKDLGLALALATEGGIDATQLASTHELLATVRDAGFAEHYYPAMIRAIERRL